MHIVIGYGAADGIDARARFYHRYSIADECQGNAVIFDVVPVSPSPLANDLPADRLPGCGIIAVAPTREGDIRLGIERGCGFNAGDDADAELLTRLGTNAMQGEEPMRQCKTRETV